MIDATFWNGKRVLVTGHTGFKGSWLSLWLSSMGAKVTGFALEPPTVPSLFIQANIADRVQDIRGDVRDLATIKKAVVHCKPEIAIHMAAQPIVRESYIDPVGTYATNVMGTVNVLEALRTAESLRSIVVVTTDKCYENKEWVWGYREDDPMGGYDPYSNSKGCAELVVSSYRRSFFNPLDHGKKHTVALASARAGNVIGGGDYAKDRLIPDIIRSLQAKEKILIRSPYAIRPWQHVLEPLSGYLLLAQKLYVEGCVFGESWNFGPNDTDAKPVEWIVKYLCDIIPENKGYEVDKNPQPHEAGYLKLDISKVKSRLGWQPKWNLDKTLALIMEWYNRTNSGETNVDVCNDHIRLFQDSN